MKNCNLLNNNNSIVHCKDCCYGYESYLHKYDCEKVFFCNLASDAINTYRMMWPDCFCAIGHHHKSERPNDPSNYEKVKSDNIAITHCKDCAYCRLERKEADDSPDGYWDTYYCEYMPQCSVVTHSCDFCSSGTPKDEEEED